MTALPLLLLLLAPGQAADAAPPSWIEFYHRENPGLKQVYFYDPASIRTDRGIVTAQWRVANSDSSVTLYGVRIDCRQDRWSETGTTVVEADGKARTLPAAELLRDLPIDKDSATADFRRKVCP